MSSQHPPTTRAGWIAAGRREPVMFESDGQAILGVIHRPRQPPAERLPAVVIFHGFVGSKDQPHQIFVKLAEALAAAGVIALRIDFRGRGDSEGDTVDMTFEGDMADARGALICSFECTYCEPCGEALSHLCPNCGGDLAARPTRARSLHARHPPATERRHKGA